MWNDIRNRGLPATGCLLVVRVVEQRLEAWLNGRLETEYPISSSRKGLGCLAGSHKTPAGLHAVIERIGDGSPVGSVFKDRQPTGEVLHETDWRGAHLNDLILTRILWLSGLEDDKNRGDGCDSHERFIYIHGTNHEELLGQPASAGCIRVGNRDMLDLFERTKDKTTWVWIG